MTALIVVLMFVAFVALDFLVRDVTRRMREQQARKAREAVLNQAVRLDSEDEAKSLKRVEVPEPKARILAVDDESVVLDSFRRILVLEGYSVDTVERGPEALGLVQRRDYDFVFTDLKMPDMDGVEVVKAVKHLRPDVDVVVITGYGTIETAVETLQQGACEYVQKPFTAEELADFVGKLVIKREARLEAQRRPHVRVVTPAMAEAAADHDYCVPGGAFLSEGHAWVRLEPSGQVRIGLDDFARKALVAVQEIALPEAGREVRRGEPLFTLRKGADQVRFLAPVSGKVVHGNDDLKGEPALLNTSPYEGGWVCLVQPSDLAGELGALKVGKPVVAWYQEEIARYRKAEAGKGLAWTDFEAQFLRR